MVWNNLRAGTLPETNSSPLKLGLPNRKVVLKPSVFRGYVSFREGRSYSFHLFWLIICRFGHPHNGPWCGHVLSKNHGEKNCRLPE